MAMVLSHRSGTSTDDLGRFEQSVIAQRALTSLSALFTAATQPFGITAFAIGHLEGGGRPSCIFLTTWPRAWIEHYAVSGLIAVDPIVSEARRSPEPWADLKTRPDQAGRAVWDHAARFGFLDGLAVPIHGPGDARGLVALAAERLRLPAERRPELIAKARICYAVALRLFDARERASRLRAASARRSRSWPGRCRDRHGARDHPHLGPCLCRAGEAPPRRHHAAQAVAMAATDGML